MRCKWCGEQIKYWPSGPNVIGIKHDYVHLHGDGWCVHFVGEGNKHKAHAEPFFFKQYSKICGLK